MKRWQRIAIAALALSLSACAGLSRVQRDRASEIALAARPTQIDCAAPNACAQPSPLRALACLRYGRRGESRVT